MTTAPATIRVMVVDPDPVFRAGLVNGLSRLADLQIVVEAASPAIAWRTLTDVTELGRGSRTPIDLIIIGLGLEVCQLLKTQYPHLPVLLIERLSDAELLKAFQLGIEGYCPKGSAIARFEFAIREVAAGQRCWQPETLEQLSRVASQSAQPGLFAMIRQHWRSSSLKQIDAAIQDINAQLQYPRRSALDQVFLAGRRRELKAARWVAERLFATPQMPAPELPQPMEQLPASTAMSRARRPSDRAIANPLRDIEPVETIETASISAVSTPPDSNGIVFDQIAAKLQSNLENLTDLPLEIDILKQEKKRELFFVILRQLEAVLDELRFSQVQLNQLGEKKSAILQDVWQAVVMNFFGRYYTLNLKNRDIEVVPAILQDAETIRTELLDPIPLVTDVLSHLLFQTPLTIEQTAYQPNTPEATNRTIDLLENLIIQIANAVIQPLLNRFSNLETIKRGFYDRRLLSTREIERFRNDLSWRYRVEKYVAEPKAIFESRYRLWVLSSYGIERLAIYSPRNEELETLSGVQLAMTLALETRDAIAPRLRAAIAFLGSGIVYVLTEVIGRGIGLIGRGILKGIGKSVRG
ncbi:DUF3685 domain-containing protein [Myxacorys almedinensis]|uniref:DUF3685 domain-containing protein n=1 Tax=Myxacorys almedinensis A TaxID=2690445 RepID=A0A8J8CM86_9CYAN|nr:DUF3685 domain-containing protein [Myxacorys almedinensis]NDJ18470.1 DUF3685 domain-containing protein [Myxacorys almedinensis A]